jgi:hypothetical protein
MYQILAWLFFSLAPKGAIQLKRTAGFGIAKKKKKRGEKET